MDLLPVEGARATPCFINLSSVPYYPSYACSGAVQAMPTVLADTTNAPGITVDVGANDYRLIGLEVTPKVGTRQDSRLVDLTGADHIIVDRCVIHGPTNPTYDPTLEVEGGVAAAGTNLAVINSWVYDTMCIGGCVDSHAIGAGTGSYVQGPIKIYNDLLASAAETWMFGGGRSDTPYVPRDVEIRHNHSFKPLSWFLHIATGKGTNGPHPLTKNLGEFKNAQRVLMEANVHENSWTGWQEDQFGYALLIGPKSQNSHEDALYVNASGTQVSCAMDTSGTPCAVGKGTFVAHNTGATIGYAGGRGGFGSTLDLHDATARQYLANFVYRDNIGPATWWGLYKKGDPVPSPPASSAGIEGQLNYLHCDTGLPSGNCTWTFAENLFGLGLWAGQSDNVSFPASYPSSNQTCGSAGAQCELSGSSYLQQFVNYNAGLHGDYHLITASPYKSAGTDGKDLGADIDTMQSRQAGAWSPTAYAPLSVTTTSPLPNATSGTAYSTVLAASAGASPYKRWSVVSGTLPSGLTLTSDGTISGTPTAAGNSTFTVQVIDGGAQIATAKLVLTVQ